MRGFTLIEVLVYLGLLSMILTATLFTMDFILTASQKMEADISKNEEKNFIFNAAELTINNMTNKSYSSNESYNLTNANDQLFLQANSSQPILLNTNRIEVSGLAIDQSSVLQQIEMTINNEPLLLKKYQR